MEKYFECPNFGFVFEAPAMDIKFSHTGVTFPGFGLVKCPQCKEEKRRKYYKIVPESDLAKKPQTIQSPLQINTRYRNRGDRGFEV